MGNNLKSFKTDRIIFAAGAIVLGVVLLVWPSTSLLIMGKCIGAILAAGGLVAFPTETVYGLGGNALDRIAMLAGTAHDDFPETRNRAG